MSQFSTGFVHIPEAVEQVCAEMAQAGNNPFFASARPEISGFWERCKKMEITGIFLWQWELAYRGGLIESDAQWAPADPGTCVARSGYRAIQDSHGTAIMNGLIVGSPVALSYEAAYGGGRVKVGRGALGYGGGMVVGWFAKYVRENGILPRGVYGQYDLTRSRPELAEQWGRPGVGTPSELESLSRKHIVPAVHMVRNTTELADALAARFAGNCGSATKFGGRDQNGEARPQQLNYHHAEEWCGVYVRPDGSTGFVRQDSHGNDAHNGPSMLRYAGGTIQLRLGAYGVSERDVAPLFAQGENWMYAPPKDIRPSTVTEMIA